MARRILMSDVYGKIIYKEDYWQIEEEIDLEISGKKQLVKGEIDVFSMIYEEKKLGLLDKKQIEFYESVPSLVNEKKARAIEELQKYMFQKIMQTSEKQICKNIEEAALRKREERLKGQTEKSFAKLVGKERAHCCFQAKTREEKLSSIKLKKMRIMKDSIEITCKCDWYRPSGRFVIFKDGSVEMLYADSTSIW